MNTPRAVNLNETHPVRSLPRNGSGAGMGRGGGRGAHERGGAAIRCGTIAGLTALVMAAGVTAFGVASDLEAGRAAAASGSFRDDGLAAADDIDDIVTGSIQPADACDDDAPVTAFWRQTLGRC
jgi:hypothetical protein